MAIRFSVSKVQAILLALVVQVAFAQAVWNGSADVAWYTSNESATEFTINTAEELAGLAMLANRNLQLKLFKLGANIMLNDTANWEDWVTNPPANEWVPIGTRSNKFNGKFDGNGYVVSGVYVNSENDYQGLFGYTDGDVEIKNLGVTASYIKGENNVGGLVGYNYVGKIINSHFIGVVTGRDTVGGLAGVNDNTGTISNSHFNGTVTGEMYVGGLVGTNRSTVSNSYSVGTFTGKMYVGGLVGTNRSVGTNISTVSNSYSAGTVTGENHIGGLAGLNNNGTVEKSYFIGTVDGGSVVGGLAGSAWQDSKTTHNYVIGTITGANSVGGLIGHNYYCSTGYNYFVGNVIGTGNNVGAVVGKNEGFGINYNYYDCQVYGQYCGPDNAKTTAELKRTMFNRTNWGINDAINDGYPYLLWSEERLCLEANNVYVNDTCKTTEQIDCEATEGMVWKNNSCTTTPIHLPQIVKNQIAVRAVTGGVVLENLPTNAKAEMYNIHGKRIYSGNPENPKILKIMVQTKGIYIVKVGTQTFRVAVGQK
jgi:hypothetical protein